MICRRRSACSIITECILDLHHPEPDLGRAEICKKFSHVIVLSSALCLMNETELQFYQLLTTEMSSVSILLPLAKQPKLQYLSCFVTFYFFLVVLVVGLE